MSKKVQLKNDNKDLLVDYFDLINNFDCSKTNKFTGFLIKEFRKNIEMNIRQGEFLEANINEIKYLKKPPENILNKYLTNMLFSIFGYENIDMLRSYATHLEADRIDLDKRDINKIKNWQELSDAVSLAEIKMHRKRLEKETMIVFEDDEYLVIRPLSYESSLTYGRSTRWCTSSTGNPEYFYRYSKNGVLCYLINKNTNQKFGFMYETRDSKEFSIWSVEDVRVDSIQTGLPEWIVRLIYNYSRVENTNWFYFSDEVKKSENLKSNKIRALHFEDEVARPRDMGTLEVAALDYDNWVSEEEPRILGRVTEEEMNYGLNAEDPIF